MFTPPVLFALLLVSGAAPEADPRPPAGIEAAPGRGITLSARDDFELTLRPRLQLRETFRVVRRCQDACPTETHNELGVRALRVILSGFVLRPELTFGVQLGFGPQDLSADSPGPVFDAWVEYALHRDARLRAGQFVVPHDRARLTRDQALQLVDRPLVVSELTLDREVGLLLSSADLFGWEERLGYAVGIFSGAGRSRIGFEDPGLLYAARVTWRPFGRFDDNDEGDLQRLHRPRLAVGLGAALNRNTDRARSTHGPVLPRGKLHYQHAAADVVFKYAGFFLLSEVLYRRGEDGREPGAVARSSWGYLLQAGMMVSPAVEVAGRWNELRALAGAPPAWSAQVREEGREAGVGVSVFLNGHSLKLQADYARRFGRDLAGVTHLGRLQLEASL